MARMTIAAINTQLSTALTRAERAETALAEKDAVIQALQSKVYALEQRPVASAPLQTGKPEPTDFGDYYAYVRAARQWCNKNGRAVSYKSQEQYRDAWASL